MRVSGEKAGGEAERWQGRAEARGDEMEWESKSVRMVSISLA